MKWALTFTLFLFFSLTSISQGKPENVPAPLPQTPESKLQLWATIIGTILSAGVFTYVIKLKDQQAKVKDEIVSLKDQQGKVKDEVASLKDEKLDILKEKMGVKDERLTKVNEDLTRAEKEITDLKAALNQYLNKGGIDFEKLAQGQKLQSDVVDQVRNLTNELSGKMNDYFEKLNSVNEAPRKDLTESNLAIAKSQMAQGNFKEAIKAFDVSEKNGPLNWDMYFSRGVAYANLRQGRDTNLKSLKAYSDAIVYLPDDIDPNVKARIFSYRGAMNKRLLRFDQALNDLDIALKHSRVQYEIDDINYNFASVYAMMNVKEKMLEHIKRIKSRRFINGILAHLDDYFKNFANDPDFKNALTVAG